MTKLMLPPFPAADHTRQTSAGGDNRITTRGADLFGRGPCRNHRPSSAVVTAIHAPTAAAVTVNARRTWPCCAASTPTASGAVARGNRKEPSTRPLLPE